MAPLFSEELLDYSVRYSTDSDLWNGLAQFTALHTTAGAVTLVNVIVFKDETGANSPDSPDPHRDTRASTDRRPPPPRT
jgi:hypothetical protein